MRPIKFEDFIGQNIKLDPVIMKDKTNIEEVLSYYMGKNTPLRQEFIIDNLKVELDQIATEESEVTDLVEAESL